ncbi:unnamed protein product, partial [Amoebophrya sp. A120]
DDWPQIYEYLKTLTKRVGEFAALHTSGVVRQTLKPPRVSSWFSLEVTPCGLRFDAKRADELKSFLADLMHRCMDHFQIRKRTAANRFYLAHLLAEYHTFQEVLGNDLDRHTDFLIAMSEYGYARRLQVKPADMEQDVQLLRTHAKQVQYCMPHWNVRCWARGRARGSIVVVIKSREGALLSKGDGSKASSSEKDNGNNDVDKADELEDFHDMLEMHEETTKLRKSLKSMGEQFELPDEVGMLDSDLEDV